MFWRSKKCCFRRKGGGDESKTTDQKVISHSVSGITNGSIVPWIALLNIKMMLRWLRKVNNLVATKSNLGEFMSCGKFGSLFMRHNLKNEILCLMYHRQLFILWRLKKNVSRFLSSKIAGADLILFSTYLHDLFSYSDCRKIWLFYTIPFAATNCCTYFTS